MKWVLCSITRLKNAKFVKQSLKLQTGNFCKIRIGQIVSYPNSLEPLKQQISTKS